MDIIKAPYVFRKTATGTMEYDRSIDVPGSVEKYMSNGTVHVAKTASSYYVSTNGTSFTAISTSVVPASATSAASLSAAETCGHSSC